MKRSDDCLDPLPYYKWHWMRYRASRKVQRMSVLERGIYRELLDEQWSQGYIDIQNLPEILEDSKQVLASAQQVLSKCFTEISPGIWQNQTLEEQRTANDALRAKRKIAGHLGAVAKSDAQANAKQVLASARDEEASASKCHIEEKIREEKRTPDFQPPKDSDEIIFRIAKAYPKLSHLRSEMELNPSIAEAIIKAITSDPHEDVLKGTVEYARLLDDPKFAMDPYKYFTGFHYRISIPKVKPLPVSPAERRRKEIEEDNRRQAEEALRKAN